MKGEIQEESNNGHRDIFVIREVEWWALPQSTKEQFWFYVRKSFETLGGVEKVELCGPWMVRVWMMRPLSGH